MSKRKRTLTDENFIAWLENPLITLGTPLRMEIAARYRKLTREPKHGKDAVPSLGKSSVSEPRSGADSGENTDVEGAAS